MKQLYHGAPVVAMMKTSACILFIPAVLTAALLLLSCKKDKDSDGIPDCINAMMERSEKGELGEELLINAVYKVKHKRKTYYYTVSECCDQFNYVYDSRCNRLCAPDGGFTGTGTGDCPEGFPTDRQEYELIWEK